jgi:hypothetical protein
MSNSFSLTWRRFCQAAFGRGRTQEVFRFRAAKLADRIRVFYVQLYEGFDVLALSGDGLEGEGD